MTREMSVQNVGVSFAMPGTDVSNDQDRFASLYSAASSCFQLPGVLLRNKRLLECQVEWRTRFVYSKTFVDRQLALLMRLILPVPEQAGGSAV